jgi:hypothetical protein
MGCRALSPCVVIARARIAQFLSLDFAPPLPQSTPRERQQRSYANAYTNIPMELPMENTFIEDGRMSLPRPTRSEENAVSGARSVSRVSAGSRSVVRDLVRRAQRNVVRELYDWARCGRVALPNVAQLNRTLSALDFGAKEDDGNESPIFLLSTGWRSGSTLLQRILVTDPSVLLWGEPLGEMALISQITTMFTRRTIYCFLPLRHRGSLLYARR